jgi:RNA polymerase sigma-70 factor (ECF subfamily)
MVEGDKQAFKYFFKKYYSELCNFVNIYLKDTSLSEEVVQDIFVYFWEHRSKVNIHSSVRAYLFGASKYRSLNELRKQKQLPTGHDSASVGNLQALPDETEDCFTNPEELKNILDQAIQQLPEKCKEVFLLSKKENLSNKDIAGQLNISVKTVENQITIALKKLRAHLSPYREKLFLLFLIDLFIK